MRLRRCLLLPGVLALGLFGFTARGLGQFSFACSELPFTLENEASASRYLPETTAGGLALFDADNDGDLDIFFANGAKLPSLVKSPERHANALLLNDGAGRFALAGGAGPVQAGGYDIGVAAADYDNDGDTDLFVAGVHGWRLLANNGAGKFSDVTRAAGLSPAPGEDRISVGGLWLDADRDGDLDLFVVQYVVWQAADDPRCEVNGVRDYCHPSHYPAAANQLFHNDGKGKFQDVSGPSGVGGHSGKGMATAAADYDGDGDDDIFVTNDRVPNFLFVNGGKANFTERALESGVALPLSGDAPSSMGAVFDDLNGDGLPDIFFTALADETFPLFLNAGDGFFDDATYASGLSVITRRMAGWSALADDFDNDGYIDLFVTRSDALAADGGRAATARQTNSLFLGRDGGKFVDASAAAGLSNRPKRMYRGAAAGDLNADGLLDVVVSALGEPAEVCLGRQAAPHHWIAVELQGKQPARNAIGAQVSVVHAGRKQTRRVKTTAGYASSSSAPLHFGLGGDAKVDSVEIRWPSGATQRLAGPAPEKLHTVTEP